MSAKKYRPLNEELVRRVIKGGPEQSDRALRDLLDRVRIRFLPFVLRRADRSSSEDIIAATSARIWQKLHQFDPAKGSFEDWAFAIVRNCIIDHHRGLQRDATVSVLTDQIDSRVDIAEQTVLKDQIKRALGGLSELDRELVVMSSVHGLKAKEIRQVLASRGIRLTRSAIYNRIHRARKTVKAKLSED